MQESLKCFNSAFNGDQDLVEMNILMLKGKLING